MTRNPRAVAVGLAAPATASWQLSGCGCGHDGRSRVHHDRLLRLEDDIDELVELLELAVTWQELDYSGQDVVAPERWVDFASSHRWRDAARTERLFGLAADVALRGADRAGAFHDPIGITAPDEFDELGAARTL